MVPLLFWCVNIRIMSCVCIYSISFYFCHNKLTRQILYVVIYFFCKVFLTIHTLVYVITFVLCHHLYLDVCVCVHKYWIYQNCLYIIVSNFLQKVTNYEVFSLFRFLFNKKYIQNMHCFLLVLFWPRHSKGETKVC